VPVDFADAERLLRDLETFAAKAVPFAIRRSLNDSAFLGREVWIRQIEGAFILRNKFTTRRVRVVKASGSDPDRMESVLGHLEPFMALQESGGVERGKGGRAKPVPTAVAAGQSPTQSRHTRAIRRPNWLSAIRLQRGRRAGGSRKQRNIIAMKQAAEQKGRNRFALIEVSGGGKAIHKVTGRKRLRTRRVYNLGERSVRIGPHPTLGPALDKLNPTLPTVHVRNIIEQLRFHRVLGY